MYFMMLTCIFVLKFNKDHLKNGSGLYLPGIQLGIST